MSNLLKKEINYIKKWYGIKLVKDISKILKISESKIVRKANYLGLKSNLTKTQPSIKNFTSEVYKGKKFNPLKMIGPYLGSGIKTIFLCPFCNTEFLTTPSHVKSRHTKSCGCTSLGKRKGTQNISQSFFDRFLRGARIRNIIVEIDINFLEELLIKQNFKCALSGWPLISGYIKLKNYTLSIDRIDSSKSYNKDNIQLVHKDINYSKQDFDQDYFFKICKDIVNNAISQMPN